MLTAEGSGICRSRLRIVAGRQGGSIDAGLTNLKSGVERITQRNFSVVRLLRMTETELEVPDRLQPVIVRVREENVWRGEMANQRSTFVGSSPSLLSFLAFHGTLSRSRTQLYSPL